MSDSTTDLGPVGRLRSKIIERRLAAPLLVCALAFILSFWQRPHELYSDTRIELLTNPGLFLSRVTQMWTSTVDLGHMGASQFVGYLFPMGPFFWIGDLVGLPTWIVQRLWIFALLAIAGWGVVRLVEVVRPSATALATFVAAVIFITSPFVVVSLSRGTSWLVPFAVLPWLLLATIRGIREPKAWRYPALIALAIAASGGGLNAALLFWLLVALFSLGVFEAITATGRRALWSLTWRSALLTFVTSLWWIVPTLAQARYGADYLTYTEHAEAILHTSSASESLRLLGYWLSYSSTYPNPEAQFPGMMSYLLSLPTILAGFLVPLATIAALRALPRWRYGAYFGLLLALSVVAMSAGFPPTSRVGSAIVDLYYNAGPLQFVRTTYKAAPLAGVAIAVLAGVGLGALFERARTLRLRVNGSLRKTWPAMSVIGVVLAGLVISWGRPLWNGDAISERLAFGQVPAAWTDAVANAQQATPAGTRVGVFPGELFGSYRWGETQNSVAPALSERPVLMHQADRLASDQAAQLLTGVNQRIQQGRLTPGQLTPLLRLMGVGRLLVGTDSSRLRSETLDPARLYEGLQQQPGFAKPAATFGPFRRFSPPSDRGGASVRLPQVRAYAAPAPALPRINRVHVAEYPVVVDGDADGIIELAGAGDLNPQRASFYAADLSRAQFDEMVPSAPTLVFTDSNRRRSFLPSKLLSDTGAVVGQRDPLNRLYPSYDPFARRGSQSRTVAVYSGLSGLYAPSSTGFVLSPDHRAYAAFDGDIRTSWLTQEENPAKRYIELTFKRPRRLSSIRIRPHDDQGARTSRLFVSVNGDPEKAFRLHAGWNVVPVREAEVTKLRLRVPGRITFFGPSASGLDEVSIPGLKVTEALRMPQVLAGLASGADLARSPIEVLAERVTADFPRRTGKPLGPASAVSPLDVVDAEQIMRRIVTLPEARRFTASGWVSVPDVASDTALDRLASVPARNRYTSSSRFEGVPINRASSAFDRQQLTAWRAEFSDTNRPWIQWQGDSPVSVSRLRLFSLPGRFLRPTKVNVSTPFGGFDLPVGRDGSVILPRTVRSNRLRVTVLRAAPLSSSEVGAGQTRTVAIAKLEIPGVPAANPRRTGSFNAGCSAVSVAASGVTLGLRVTGDVRELDNGSQLWARECEAHGLRLKKGSNLIATRPGAAFTLDLLKLVSDAPAPLASIPAPATLSPSGRVSLEGAGWLVLGQSYSPGWRASCRDAAGNEHDLGTPRQIDGFANGWPITGSSCKQASFRFAPQRAGDIAYAISVLGAVALLVILFLGFRRSRGRKVTEAVAPMPVELDVNTADSLSLSISRPRQITEGSVRPRVVAWFYAISAIAILALPFMYVLNPDPNPKAINFDYPLHHVAAHWVALGAMALLTVGALVDIVSRRNSDHDDH